MELYYNEENISKLPSYVLWGALIFCDNLDDIYNILFHIMNDEERKIFMDNLSKLTREDLFYTEEEALEWAEWERRTIISDAKKEGLEEGIEQTIKDTILSMLENNLSLELISKVTNKTIDEIEAISKE